MPHRLSGVSSPAARLALLVVGGAGLALHVACSVQDSRLITREVGSSGQAAAHPGSAGAAGAGASVLGVSGSGPVTPAVVAAIDERPIGGASLGGGTTGGGTYDEALRSGGLHYVDDEADIRRLIGSDVPAVLLIAEGTYTFATTPTSIPVCLQACDPATPLAQQTSAASYCTNGEATFRIDDTQEYLRFGKNKTLIGLGRGATFRNAMISLSNVSNIILRNLALEDVGPGVNGVGYGINLWPGDHVWVDHCTFRNIGHAYVQIASTLDDANGQEVSVETGYITITHNYFDGSLAGACGQRSPFVLGTNRNPALTLAYNWFDHSRNRNPYLFGPETWAHVFNNYWSDIDQVGLAVACGAGAIVQGNVFESTTAALYNNDDGATAWEFCSAGLFGRLYAPMNGGTDEDNLVDGQSTLALHEQPTDGAGLVVPVRTSGHTFTVTVPSSAGPNATYEATLIADPATVAAQVRAGAGVGTLF